MTTESKSLGVQDLQELTDVDQIVLCRRQINEQFKAPMVAVRWEVRDLVDKDWLVIRTWIGRNQSWEYKVEHVDVIQYQLEMSSDNYVIRGDKSNA